MLTGCYLFSSSSRTQTYTYEHCSSLTCLKEPSRSSFRAGEHPLSVMSWCSLLWVLAFDLGIAFWVRLRWCFWIQSPELQNYWCHLWSLKTAWVSSRAQMLTWDLGIAKKPFMGWDMVERWELEEIIGIPSWEEKLSAQLYRKAAAGFQIADWACRGGATIWCRTFLVRLLAPQLSGCGT